MVRKAPLVKEVLFIVIYLFIYLLLLINFKLLKRLYITTDELKLVNKT